MDVPHFVDGYPPPEPPTKTREEIFNVKTFAAVDKKAREAPEKLLSSHDAVLDHLVKGSTSDLAKVRSIFVWLSAQQVFTMTFPKIPRGDTPHVWLKNIRTERNLYADFFALLCRKAGVPCVIIEGSSKGAGFQVGQKGPLKVTNRWNAVHVLGEWRLVNVPWALIIADGLAEGEWELVEKAGQAVREKEVCKKEVRQELDEFWFLTDPEDFNAFCHPKDSQWQLLKLPWTEEEFLTTPRYSEDFFTSEWQLMTSSTGVLDADGGRCQVVYCHPKGAKSASLTYNLYYNTTLSPKPLPDTMQLDRYVMGNGKEGEKMLVTRLPQDGVYRIEVAGILDGVITGLGEFRINCHNVGTAAKAFPEGCSQIGFSEACREAGVVEVSQQDGIVDITPGERMDFRLKFESAATAPHTLQAFLTHNDKKPEELSRYVHVTKNKEEVNVSVQVPGDHDNTEYGLIMAAPNKSSRDISNQSSSSRDISNQSSSEISYNALVSYIITSDTKLVSEETKNCVETKNELLSALKNFDRAKLEKALKKLGKLDPKMQSRVNEFQKGLEQAKVKAVQTLIQAMQGSDINQLEQALTDCQKFDSVNTDVTKQAKVCLDLMKLLKDDVDVALLEKTLRHAYDVKLHNNPTTQKAEEELMAQHEKGLYEAYQTRTMKALKEMFLRLEKSCVAARVKGEFMYGKAQELLEHLEAMKRLTDKISNMKASEVKTMAGTSGKEGHPHVKSVLMATFILLGEREQELWEWSVLQKLLERRGKEGVSGAMAALDVDQLTEKQVSLAESHVRQCQVDVIRAESSGAALYLQWVQAIVEEKRGRDAVRAQQSRQKKM